MWVTSTKGLELWRRRVMRTYVEPMEYRKGYQNQGPDNGIANFLMNIDHDPHTFIVPNVTKEEEFEVCIHGRSTRFEVFRVVLVKCEGYRCIGGRYHDIAERETSPCV